MLKYREFEKLADLSNTSLAGVSTIELVCELAKRSGIELITLDYGTSVTSTLHGPKVILEISIEGDETT